MKKILTFCLFLTLNANALEEAVNKSEEVSKILAQNAYEPNYFSMIFGLFLVVAMIYITGFLYQKLTKASVINKDLLLNKAQIISTTSLGQGRNIHIIQIGDSACLIGATQNNITFLKDIELQEIKREEKANDKNS